MEKKIQMARQEEERRPVLLADTRARTFSKYSTSGNKGQKETGHAKGYKGKAPVSYAEASKSDAEAKTASGNGRGRKHRLFHSPGVTVRKAKGRDSSTGRYAEELGIKWLDANCNVSPSKAHHLIAKTFVDTGRIWECKYCHKITWLPASTEECLELGQLLHIYGLDAGFQKFLSWHPAATRMLVQMQDIYYLKKSVPEDMLPKVLACVVADKAYPYDVDIVEEEMP